MEKSGKMHLAATVAALAIMAGTGIPAVAQQSAPASQQQKNPQQGQQNMGQGGNVQSEKADQQEQSQTTQSNSGDRNKIASVNLDRSQIEQVQRALDQKGFNVGHVDGIVGNETEGALRSFQQKQGLQASGQIDQETLAALGLQHMMQPSTVGQGSQKNPEPQGSNQSGSKK